MQIKFSKTVPPYWDEGNKNLRKWWMKGKMKKVLAGRWMKKRLKELELDESRNWFI